MKLASLVNLTPLKEGSMQAQELADRNSLEQLQAMRDEIFMDMQKDPSIEPEGGPVADYYGDQLNDIEAAIELLSPKRTPLTYDQAIGRVSQDQFNKSSKFDRMNEATEKSWNAVDVSRKAEKEISNKEWNSRTTKKLDMLKALNSAGKFKKDFDDERLQGWVDQNYSWEKLSRQFKLNESYSSMYETMQQGDYSAIEQGWDALPEDEKANIIGDAKSGRADYSDLEKDFAQLKSEIPDFESIVAEYLGIDEGSCGYSQEAPGGEELDTPGGVQSMDADDRTKGMLKILIQKEIAKLNEGDPEAIKGKHYPDEDTVKKLKKGPYSSGGQNAQKEGSFDKGLEDLMGKDDFEKATSNEVPGLGDTVIDDKTDIGTGKKTFIKMMMQFTDEPFLIETGLKLYDAWARGEGGLKPSRILKILQDTRS